MKNFIKIMTIVFSVCVIALVVIKIYNPNLIAKPSDAEQYVMVSDEILVEKTDADCELSLLIFTNDTICVAVTSTNRYGDRVSANSIVPIKELYDCKYNDDIIFWDLKYGFEYDHFASIVPDDCIGAKIDGILYKSKKSSIQVEDKTINFKYVLTDLEHIDLEVDNRTVLLIDEKGNLHKEIRLENPFD